MCIPYLHPRKYACVSVCVRVHIYRSYVQAQFHDLNSCQKSLYHIADTGSPASGWTFQ